MKANWSRHSESLFWFCRNMHWNKKSVMPVMCLIWWISTVIYCWTHFFMFLLLFPERGSKLFYKEKISLMACLTLLVVQFFGVRIQNLTVVLLKSMIPDSLVHVTAGEILLDITIYNEKYVTIIFMTDLTAQSFYIKEKLVFLYKCNMIWRVISFIRFVKWLNQTLNSVTLKMW